MQRGSEKWLRARPNDANLSGYGVIALVNRVQWRAMSLRPRSVKFDDRVWEMACEEASHLGMSTAAFVREAVAARCWVARIRRDPEVMDAADELYEAVRRYLEATTPDEED